MIGVMQRARFQLITHLGVTFLLAAVVGCHDGPLECTEEAQPRLTAPEALEIYSAGPDPTHGCEDDNPSSGTTASCLSGDPATGHCCGDVGYPLYCRCGAWICPERTVLISECKTHCETGANSATDGGT